MRCQPRWWLLSGTKDWWITFFFSGPTGKCRAGQNHGRVHRVCRSISLCQQQRRRPSCHDGRTVTSSPREKCTIHHQQNLNLQYTPATAHTSRLDHRAVDFKMQMCAGVSTGCPSISYKLQIEVITKRFCWDKLNSAVQSHSMWAEFWAPKETLGLFIEMCFNYVTVFCWWNQNLTVPQSLHMNLTFLNHFKDITVFHEVFFLYAV